jgi:hypothetical protein
VTITASAAGYDDVSASSNVFSTAMVKTLTSNFTKPTLTNFNGRLTCSLPQYYLDERIRQAVLPTAVTYQLYANDVLISTRVVR